MKAFDGEVPSPYLQLRKELGVNSPALIGTVLIAEENTTLLHSLADTLTALGLTVVKAITCEEAFRELALRPYTVMLLNLDMPGMHGLSACRAARKEHPDLELIVLSARTGDEDKVEALNAGADDYVTKPFYMPELVARVGAALRRARPKDAAYGHAISVGQITLDPHRYEVRKNGSAVRLTPTEFNLLHVLMASAGKPLPHRFLLTSVWGPEYGDEREYLRTYINQLRKKLEDQPSHPRHLLTEAYVGYRFALPE